MLNRYTHILLAMTTVNDIYTNSSAVSTVLRREKRRMIKSRNGKTYNMPVTQLNRHGDSNYQTYTIINADSSGTQDFGGQCMFRLRDIYALDRTDIKVDVNQIQANTSGNTADLGYANGFMLVHEAELIINGEVVERWNPNCNFHKYEMMVQDDRKPFTQEKYILGTRTQQVARNDAGSQSIYVPIKFALTKLLPNTDDIRSKEIDIRVTFRRKEQVVVCDLLADKDVDYTSVKINAMEMQVKHRKYNTATQYLSIAKQPSNTVIFIPEIHTVDVANSEAKVTLQFLNGIYAFMHMYIADRIANYDASGADLSAVNQTENQYDNAKHTAIDTYRLELNGNPIKYNFDVTTEFHKNQIVKDIEVYNENTYYSATATNSRMLSFCDDPKLTVMRGIDTGYYNFTGHEMLKLTYGTLGSPRVLFIIAYKAQMLSTFNGGVSLN